MFGKYTKAIAGFTIPLMAAVAAIIASPKGAVSATEWYGIAGAVLTGAGVYGLTNA